MTLPDPVRGDGSQAVLEPGGALEPLWRAIAVYRFACLAYAALLIALDRHEYSRFGLAWGVLGLMTAWTVFTSLRYRLSSGRTTGLLVVDLIVTGAFLFSTAALQHTGSLLYGGASPVTATWVAGPVLAWAVSYGRRAGAVAGLILAVGDFILYGEVLGAALNGMVLLLLAGVVVGHVARLAAQVEIERQRAVGAEAASRERERLARDIHDSVLQVLALVQRRGAEAGGEAAEIGRLAGQQEVALRALVGRGRPDREPAEAEVADLRALLAASGTENVSVGTPAQAVRLTRHEAEELASAVRAALDNVRRHCGNGARAWVLVEDEPAAVTVTVRDDGPGIAPGRLAQAAADGRLGVSQAISGRLRDLGGSADIRSVPGEGTEVILRVPRAG
jgi:signal transduction histidine kinase